MAQPPPPQWAKASFLSRIHDHTGLDTRHSLGLLWTSDQPDAETSIRQHTTFTRDRHPCPGEIRTHNPRKRAAADQRLRPLGHWDRHQLFIDLKKACDSVRRGVLCNLTECCTPVKLATLTFRHRASCMLGQAFRYSPENDFYIFNQQICFII